MTLFSDLDLAPQIVHHLFEHSFKTPTNIQKMAIPIILDGRDLLASAPTGTGKTLAFLIPIFQHFLDNPKREQNAARVVVLAPTRELAQQIYETAQWLIAKVDYHVILITGGDNYTLDDKQLADPYSLLIATPGRLLRYLKQEKLSLEEVEILVLDEADRMLDMGFKAEVEDIAEHCSFREQSLLFSATLEGNGVRNFSQQLLNDPVTIEAESTRKERKKINQYYYRADDLAHKKNLLIHFLKQEEVEKSIIFVKKRETVHELTSFLQSQGLKACFLEGEMEQAKRNEALKNLKNNSVSILIATDVASRGLDIDDITHVVNFDLPKQIEVYIHRIGRTARAGKKGTAVSLVEAHDFPLLQKTERYTKELIKKRVFDELRPKTKVPQFKTKKKAKLKKQTKKIKVKRI